MPGTVAYCRTAVKGALAMLAQHASSILERLVPPMLWYAVRALSMTQCDMLAVKIPAGERSGV
jgi:hypothetical protein